MYKLCINCLKSASDCTTKRNKPLHETAVANDKIDVTVCKVSMPVVPALAGGKQI